MKLDLKIVEEGKRYFGFSPYNNFIFQLDDESLDYLCGNISRSSIQIDKLLKLKLLFYKSEQVVIDNSFLFKIDTLFYSQSKREALTAYKFLKDQNDASDSITLTKDTAVMDIMQSAHSLDEIFYDCHRTASRELKMKIHSAYVQKDSGLLGENGTRFIKDKIYSNKRKIRKCQFGTKHLALDDGNLYRCPVKAIEFLYEKRHDIKTIMDRSTCYDCFARYLCGGPCSVAKQPNVEDCDLIKKCVELTIVEIIREKENENMHRY